MKKTLILLASAFLLVTCNKKAPVTSAMTPQFASSVNNFVSSTDLDNSIEPIESTEKACAPYTCDPQCGVYPFTKTLQLTDCPNCDGTQTISGTKVIRFVTDPALAQAGDTLTVVDYTLTTGGYVTQSHEVRILTNPSPWTYQDITKRRVENHGTRGGTNEWKADRTWTQVAGADTEDPNDDIFAITGTKVGHEEIPDEVNADYSAEITFPLFRSGSCCNTYQGTETITADDALSGQVYTLVLDYGGGVCDNLATMTVDDGEPQEVTLPLRLFP